MRLLAGGPKLLLCWLLEIHDTWITSQVSQISSNLLAIVLAVQAHLWLETKAIHKLLKETVRACLAFGWDKEWLECLQKTRDVSESISDVKLQAKESFHLRMLCILLLCLRQGWCEPGKRRQLLYLEISAQHFVPFNFLQAFEFWLQMSRWSKLDLKWPRLF